MNYEPQFFRPIRFQDFKSTASLKQNYVITGFSACRYKLMKFMIDKFLRLRSSKSARAYCCRRIVKLAVSQE